MGEVGGSSPPRPTIQIASKYAAILTFPLSGISLKKPICQPFVNFTICGMAPQSGRHRLGYVESAALSRRRTCKTLQGCGRTGKSFLVSLRVRSSVGWNACLSRKRSWVRVPSLITLITSGDCHFSAFKGLPAKTDFVNQLSICLLSTCPVTGAL